MKQILLTKGQVALVDDVDFKWLNKLTWHSYYDKTTKSFYAIHSWHVPKKIKTKNWSCGSSRLARPSALSSATTVSASRLKTLPAYSPTASPRGKTAMASACTPARSQRTRWAANSPCKATVPAGVRRSPWSFRTQRRSPRRRAEAQHPWCARDNRGGKSRRPSGRCPHIRLLSQVGRDRWARRVERTARRSVPTASG